jgi:hypothetical protein
VLRVKQRVMRKLLKQRNKKECIKIDDAPGSSHLFLYTLFYLRHQVIISTAISLQLVDVMPD